MECSFIFIMALTGEIYRLIHNILINHSVKNTSAEILVMNVFFKDYQYVPGSLPLHIQSPTIRSGTQTSRLFRKKLRASDKHVSVCSCQD